MFEELLLFSGTGGTGGSKTLDLERDLRGAHVAPFSSFFQIETLFQTVNDQVLNQAPSSLGG